MTKTSIKRFLAVAFLTLLFPGLAWAGTWQSSAVVTLPQDQKVEGNYYAVANQVLVEGHITGDLVCAGQIVEVKGQVDGDILCAAQELIINGDVTGSVRALAANVAFANRVKINRNVTIVAANAVFNPGMTVGMDLLAWTGNMDFYGNINGSLRAMAKRLLLAGRVAEDVDLIIEDNYKHEVVQPLIMTESARIGGDLIYKSRFDASFGDRQQIVGKVVKREIGGGEASAWETYCKIWLAMKFISFVGVLAIALLLVYAVRRPVVNLADRMIVKPLVNIGWGLILSGALPLLVIFLLMTIIGVPVAFMVLLSWLLIMLLAKPMAVIMLGMVLMGRYRHAQPKNKKAFRDIESPILTVIIGAASAYAIMAIPLVGSLFAVVISAWAIGAAWLSLMDCRKRA